METIAQKIARITRETTLERLPREAVGHAKLLTLDVLASMVGARDLVSSVIARQTALELGGPPEASVIGDGRKISAPAAAFANAVQCYGLDFVDDHNESNAHPSPATFPVSLALSEALRLSGRRFLEAVCLGNEVVCRMGSAYLGEMYYQGFHPTSTCGTMGAAVSAAKLMDLGEDCVTAAQGIAGSMVAGLMAWNSQGSFTKRLQAGHPALNAILAARMAEKGFGGPADIYEGRDGLLHAYSYRDRCDASRLTEGLGEDWIFAKSSFKIYPCCRYSGGHLDCCLDLVERYHPKAEDIAAVHIRSSKYTMQLLAAERKWSPQNVVDLQFSMPYQAAAAFVFGRFTVHELDTGHLENPGIRRLMAAVRVTENPEFEKRYPEHYSCAVEITMKDGSRYETAVDDPKGDWRNPVAPEEIENKFRTLSDMVWHSPEKTDRVIRFVQDLEDQPDLSLLAGILTGQQAAVTN